MLSAWLTQLQLVGRTLRNERVHIYVMHIGIMSIETSSESVGSCLQVADAFESTSCQVYNPVCRHFSTKHAKVRHAKACKWKTSAA